MHLSPLNIPTDFILSLQLDQLPCCFYVAPSQGASINGLWVLADVYNNILNSAK